jgi:hypothetical protein
MTKNEPRIGRIRRLLFRRTSAALFDTRRKIVADGQGLTRSASRWLTGVSWPVALRVVRTYRRAYLAASNADGPEAEVRPAALLVASPIVGIRPDRLNFDAHRLDGPTHSNTPRYCNRPSGVRLRVCLRQNLGFESKVSRGRNRRESITTVLRRSSAEEKLVGKSRVHSPFSI